MVMVFRCCIISTTARFREDSADPEAGLGFLGPGSLFYGTTSGGITSTATWNRVFKKDQSRRQRGYEQLSHSSWLPCKSGRGSVAGDNHRGTLASFMEQRKVRSFTNNGWLHIHHSGKLRHCPSRRSPARWRAIRSRSFGRAGH